MPSFGPGMFQRCHSDKLPWYTVAKTFGGAEEWSCDRTEIVDLETFWTGFYKNSSYNCSGSFAMGRGQFPLNYVDIITLWLESSKKASSFIQDHSLLTAFSHLLIRMSFNKVGKIYVVLKLVSYFLILLFCPQMLWNIWEWP